MKLHALNLHSSMTQAHDDAIVCSRRNLQAIGQTCVVDDKRMITARGETLIDSGKDRLAIVFDLRRFAVENFRRPHDAPTKHLPDRLMAQAITEDWCHAAKSSNRFHRDSGIVRRAGAWRDYNPLRF